MTCTECPDNTTYARSIDKAVATFTAPVHLIAIDDANGNHTSHKLADRSFSFTNVADEIAHLGHRGGGWFAVWAENKSVIDVAIWQITNAGTLVPLKRNDPRMGNDKALRYSIGFNVVDAWQI